MAQDLFEATTSTFLSWLAAKGVQINPKIAIHDFRKEGRGRGVICVADLQEDEILFSIPRNAVFNFNNALSILPIGPMQEAIAAMPPWLALTTLMLIESLGSDSNWAPYLAILPQQLDSLIFWSAGDIAQLQASTVSQKIGRDKAEKMFTQHVAPLGLSNYDIDLLHRVASIIMAYAFDIPEERPSDVANGNETTASEEGGDDLVSDNGEDEKTILSMIPLADMLNADADKNNARLCCDHEDLEMRSIKPIAIGEEIFNDYGQLPRSDLLRRYGYVTEQYAAYDVAEISTKSIISAFSTGISIPGNQHVKPLSIFELDRRVELAEREGFYEESYDLAHPGPDGPSIPDELIALIYLLLLDNENLISIEAGSSISSRSKITTELVGQTLAMLLQQREDEYGTSVEEDETIIQKSGLSHRVQKALQVRIGEKHVLRAAIKEAKYFTASNKRMRGAQTPAESGENKKRKLGETGKNAKRGRFT